MLETSEIFVCFVFLFCFCFFVGGGMLWGFFVWGRGCFLLLLGVVFFWGGGGANPFFSFAGFEPLAESWATLDTVVTAVG